jgi:hypothetical protein
MDNATVFVQQVDRHVARVDVLDIMTGRRRTLGVFSPADRAGVNGVSEIFVTPDTRAYAYSYLRFLSTLYLLDEVP